MNRRYQKKKYSRPTYSGCGKMVANDAARALAMAKGIKRLINVEIKNFDNQQTAVLITDTPAIIQLSNIAIGDTTNSRDGSQCKMIGVDLNFTLFQNASAVLTYVRIMLVIDKQTNQAIYTAADLLEDVTQKDAIVSPRNLDNLKRFTVLYDRVFELCVNGDCGAVVKKYFKKDVLLRYDGSTPSIADLTQSSLSLFQVGSEATNDPSIVSFVRLRFIDN